MQGHGQKGNYAWLRAVQDMPRRDGVLSHRGKAVAAGIFRHANQQGRGYPSQARLQLNTGFSNKATLREGIRELERLGFLEVDRTGRVHRYRLVIPEGRQGAPAEPVKSAEIGLRESPPTNEPEAGDRMLGESEQAPVEPLSGSAGAPNPYLPSITPNRVGEEITRAREALGPGNSMEPSHPARGSDPELEALADLLEDEFIVDPGRGVRDRRMT